LVKELQSLALNVELMESDILTEQPHNLVEETQNGSGATPTESAQAAPASTETPAT
jgi:hypothetical protein